MIIRIIVLSLETRASLYNTSLRKEESGCLASRLLVCSACGRSYTFPVDT